MVNKKNMYGTRMASGSIGISIGDNFYQIFWILLLSVMYFARDIGGVYFPDLVFSGLCAIAFFVLDYGAALGVYAFTTSLTLPENEIMLFYLLIILLKRYRDNRMQLHAGMLCCTFALLVLQMLDMALFTRMSWMNMLYQYITKMLYIIIPLIWFSYDTTPKQYKRAVICYVWGLVFGAAIVLIITGNQIGWAEMFRSNQYTRLGVADNATAGRMQTRYNANQLGGMMAIALSYMLVLMERKTLSKPVSFITIAFITVIIALTKSRTGLLCACGVVALYLLYVMVSSRQWFKGILFVLAILIVIGMILYFFPDVFSGLFSRFEDQEDMTNGRADLLVIYLQEWLSDPWCFLFGYGIGSFQEVVTVHNVPHNAIADILMSWGLLGFILLLVILLSFYTKAIRYVSRKARLLVSIPALVAIVFSMAGQYLTVGYPHLRLSFLILSIQAWGHDKGNG